MSKPGATGESCKPAAISTVFPAAAPQTWACCVRRDRPGTRSRLAPSQRARTEMTEGPSQETDPRETTPGPGSSKLAPEGNSSARLFLPADEEEPREERARTSPEIPGAARRSRTRARRMHRASPMSRPASRALKHLGLASLCRRAWLPPELPPRRPALSWQHALVHASGASRSRGCLKRPAKSSRARARQPAEAARSRCPGARCSAPGVPPPVEYRRARPCC
jgi:hypothetical protein